MVKTLVTIGYHNGELEWGRLVRAEYESKGLKGDRDITFHEIQDSDVETGGLSAKVSAEIERKIREQGFGLWIDIHCGFDSDKYGKISLTYSGSDEELLSKAKQLEGVTVNDLKKIPSPERAVYLKALADVFLSKEDIEKKSGVYQRGLERTLRFINEIHDIH
jgi:hypothetical protein